jgi:hypothetical protein
MGDESVWQSLVPGVVIRRRPRGRHLPDCPTAYFIDSHWTAQKAGDAHIFDPYDHYQKPGTHKFCQTFSMMYLLDRLPEPKWNYAVYDRCAAAFIREVIERLPESHPGFMYDLKKGEFLSSGRSPFGFFAGSRRLPLFAARRAGRI